MTRDPAKPSPGAGAETPPADGLGAAPGAERGSIFRLVFTELLQRYRWERGLPAVSAEDVTKLDDRALFDLVQASRPKVPQGTWSRKSRQRGQ